MPLIINTSSTQNNTENFINKPSNANNSIQEKVIDQVLLQSSGVGLGFILAILGSILMLKWIGAGTFINNLMEKIERGIKSTTSLAESVENIVKEMKETHDRGRENHEDVMTEVKDVKKLIKEEVLPPLKKKKF